MPHDPREPRELGAELRRQGRLAEAIEVLQRALERAPRDAQTLSELAHAWRLQGELDAARAAASTALEIAPGLAGAWFNLGAVQIEQGEAARGIESYRRALEIDPGFAEAWSNLGEALGASGDKPGEISAYRRALDVNPRLAPVWSNLGSALQDSGQLAEAVSACRRAVELDPAFAPAWINLGNALVESGQDQEALRACEMALRIAPGLPEAWSALGGALRAQRRYDEAIAAQQRAIEMQPRVAQLHFNAGVTLERCGRRAEAIARYEHALSLKPAYPEALNNLASALMERGNLDEAMAQLQQAIALRPDYTDAHGNLGFLLMQLGREEDAHACFRRAIALRPDNAAVRATYGTALMSQNFWDGATAQYRRALELHPDPALAAEVQYFLALISLFRQEFEQAWPGFERRFETEHFRGTSFRKDPRSVKMYEHLPHWRGPGGSEAGEVAIWAEQGIGDQVLFSTLIPELIGTGVPFVYETDGRLVAAYRRAFPGARFVALEDPPQGSLTGASRVLAAGSLPGLFRHSRDDFARQPGRLLAARPDRVAYYRERFEALGTSLKVALSWRTARQKWWLMRKKSAALVNFAPLLQLAGVRFVDVQYGDTAAERGAVEQALGVRLTRFEDVDHFNDLEELLAILEACDLVITTSNATAHFAGALGKRTWLLYLADRAPFHYWAHAGDHRCLWYPSVEIVSAPELAEWNALARSVAAKLERELRAA